VVALTAILPGQASAQRPVTGPRGDRTGGSTAPDRRVTLDEL